MKNYKWVMGWIAIMLLGSVSCTNGWNSSWMGQWQLREYQYPDGSVQKVDSVFYSFQKGSVLTSYMGRDGAYRTMYGYYEETEDSLTIHWWEPNTNDEAYRKWFNWENQMRSFRVEELSSHRIRLNYEDTIYVFRSY